MGATGGLSASACRNTLPHWRASRQWHPSTLIFSGDAAALVFFHRRLRCLVVIDLKVGKFTHADAGQMLLYLGYAAEHWTRPGENSPVGLILCAQHNHAVAHYTLDRLPDKVLASEYRMTLPDEKTLAAEVERTQAAMESRRTRSGRTTRS